MKRLAVLLLALLMLCGCGAKPESEKEGWNRYELIVDAWTNRRVSIDIPKEYLVITEEERLSDKELVDYFGMETEEEIKGWEEVFAYPGETLVALNLDINEKSGSAFILLAMRGGEMYDALSVMEYYMNEEMEETLEQYASDPPAEFIRKIEIGGQVFFELKVKEEAHVTTWEYITFGEEMICNFYVFTDEEDYEQEIFQIFETLVMTMR